MAKKAKKKAKKAPKAKPARKAARGRKATTARKKTTASKKTAARKTTDRRKTTARARTTKPRSQPPRARTGGPAPTSMMEVAGGADAAGAFFAIILDSQPRVPDLRLTHQGPDLQTVRGFTHHDGSLSLVPADQFQTDPVEPKSLIFTRTGQQDPGAIVRLTPLEG